VAGTGADTSAAGGGTSGGGAVGVGVSRFIMPSCTTNGNCQFNDLVEMGMAFVRLLFGVSGAFLLFALVWSGIMYMTGQEKYISMARKGLIDALIGILVMLFAYALVSYLVTSLRG
jgi:hypothetical protein